MTLLLYVIIWKSYFAFALNFEHFNCISYHDRFESILILPKIIYLFFCFSWFYYRTRFGFSVFVAMRNFLTIVRWPTLRAKTKKNEFIIFLWSSICLPLQVEIFLKCWFFVNVFVNTSYCTFFLLLAQDYTVSE